MNQQTETFQNGAHAPATHHVPSTTPAMEVKMDAILSELRETKSLVSKALEASTKATETATKATEAATKATEDVKTSKTISYVLLAVNLGLALYTRSVSKRITKVNAPAPM